MSTPSEERKFLHALATPITVLRIMLNKAKDITPENSQTQAEVQKFLQKALDAIDTIERLHANHREYLYETEEKEKSHGAV